MIPISKYILNRKQKRAALVSCTLFAFMGVLGFYAFFTPFFISYLRQGSRQSTGLYTCSYGISHSLHASSNVKRKYYGKKYYFIFNPGINGVVSTSFKSVTISCVPCLYFWKCDVFRWLS